MQEFREWVHVTNAQVLLHATTTPLHTTRFLECGVGNPVVPCMRNWTADDGTSVVLGGPQPCYFYDRDENGASTSTYICLDPGMSGRSRDVVTDTATLGRRLLSSVLNPHRFENFTASEDRAEYDELNVTQAALNGGTRFSSASLNTAARISSLGPSTSSCRTAYVWVLD